MLNHFHRQHYVEALARVHLLDGRAAVVDAEVTPLGMKFGDRDVGGRRIYTDHLRAKTRQRLAQQASAAANVENAQSRQAIQTLRVAVELAARRIADIGQPQPG